MREDTGEKKPERPEVESVVSPDPDEASRQDIARVEELNELYRPLTDAVQAELSKTKSGQKMLAETRSFAEELDEVAGRAPSRDAREQARLAVHGRLMKFRERYGEQLIAAQAPHARLRPSVEAVAQILRPEMANTTTWVSEASPSGAMQLERKRTDRIEEIDTLRQGLGDPTPFMVCIGPPFTRREDYPISPPTGFAIAEAMLDGRLWHGGSIITGLYIPMAAIGNAWVGHDFSVPEGFAQYEVTVDYEYRFSGAAFTILGVSVVNEDVAILVDNRDGTFAKSAESVCTMIVPTFAFDSFYRRGKARVTLPVTRAKHRRWRGESDGRR